MLVDAAQHGDLDEVRRLIALSYPKDDDSKALGWAAYRGHTQCVELLIPVSDPKARDSLALGRAAENGNSKSVQLLIPVSNPKSNNSQALRWAAEQGHTQCVELLYPVSDPVAALKQLKQEFPDDFSIWGQLQHMVEAERLNTVLLQEIGETTGSKVQRKM